MNKLHKKTENSFLPSVSIFYIRTLTYKLRLNGSTLVVIN